MTFDYCPRCGEKLVPKQIGDEGDVPFCGKCERPFFPYSSPCVICLCVSENDDVLLIKQSYGIIRFVCVAGYIKAGENAEDAAKREIAEETGLEMTGARFLYSKYYDKHDNLMLAFLCRVKKAKPRISSELTEAQWFSPKDAENALFQGAYGIDMLHEWQRLRDRGLLEI